MANSNNIGSSKNLLMLTSSLRPCRTESEGVTAAQTQDFTDTTGGEGGADLAPPGLDHELSGQVGGGLWLKRPDHDAFIQGVTGNDLKEDANLTGKEWFVVQVWTI